MERSCRDLDLGFETVGRYSRFLAAAMIAALL